MGKKIPTSTCNSPIHAYCHFSKVYGAGLSMFSGLCEAGGGNSANSGRCTAKDSPVCAHQPQRGLCLLLLLFR